MKTVIVGSTNPVKLETAKEAFAIAFHDEQFEFVTYAAESGIPDQPFGSEETKRGAKNRADACINVHPDADFFVGLEGGIEKDGDELWAFAWMCVRDKDSTVGYGRTGSFLIPPKVSELIQKGEELGYATDIALGSDNSKHKEGTIGILTNGAVTRKDFYREAMLFALIPFMKREYY